MQVPFHKAYITDDEISEVVDSLKSGWITMGPKTHRFEEEFGRYVGAAHSLAVSSCTAALHLALKAIDLKAGDEIIVPTMTFTATAEVVCYFNATPVIVDVERDTQNIDVKAIERAITPKTRAIIPVHFAGQPCDMDEIMAIAEERDLFVIEDAAHALPARYGTLKVGNPGASEPQDPGTPEAGRPGRMIGTIGDITCFSFYATKTLTTGEGGMVTTGSDEWADRIRTLRLHGISKDAWRRYEKEGSWYYEVVEAGYKYNMTDIQAGLGIAQMKKVGWMQSRRSEIAAKYTKAFAGHEGLLSPVVRPGRETAWHLYVIKLNLAALTVDRTRFIEELKAMGIGTSVHFIPLHRHPFYRTTFGCDARDFPAAEWVYERIISLPLYPGMTDEEAEYVSQTVSALARKFRR